MTLKNKALKTAEEFLADEEVRNILFNEVPPIAFVVVHYLKHVDDDVYTPQDSVLSLVRLAKKNQATGETEYSYFDSPSDVENKIIQFIEEHDHIERISLERNLFCKYARW